MFHFGAASRSSWTGPFFCGPSAHHRTTAAAPLPSGRECTGAHWSGSLRGWRDPRSPRPVRIRSASSSASGSGMNPYGSRSSPGARRRAAGRSSRVRNAPAKSRRNAGMPLRSSAPTRVSDTEPSSRPKATGKFTGHASAEPLLRGQDQTSIKPAEALTPATSGSLDVAEVVPRVCAHTRVTCTSARSPRVWPGRSGPKKGGIWRRRESNPRPRVDPAKLLRA